MRAVSLNFRENLIIKGLYNPRMSLPASSADAAGEVAAVALARCGWRSATACAVHAELGRRAAHGCGEPFRPRATSTACYDRVLLSEDGVVGTRLT